MVSPDRMMEDEFYMKRCLRLARRGMGRVNPNPMVGAVLVKDGEILAQGYHKGPGAPHAEILAIRRASHKLRGSTLYLNLEPCVHFGRTPPCLPSIIEAEIARAVIGMVDPNPVVNGKGIEGLRKAGIEVRVGVLEREARLLNEVYIKYITTHLPFVILKLAMGLDGRITREAGQWITGMASKKVSHSLRAQTDAILVGVETVITDDPLLTTRLVKGKDPIRVILDSGARVPLKAKVVGPKAIIATTKRAPHNKIEELEKRGLKVLILKEKEGMVDLGDLLERLGRLGIASILVEGGGRVASSFLKEGLVDKVLFFISPKILGERGMGLSLPLVEFRDTSYRRVGEDILFTGYVHRIDRREGKN